MEVIIFDFDGCHSTLQSIILTLMLILHLSRSDNIQDIVMNFLVEIIGFQPLTINFHFSLCVHFPYSNFIF